MHFYWQVLRKDVVQFCKTCHTCQVVGKPNQVIPKAPLRLIPAFEEPFSQVMIDCVGPLPKTGFVFFVASKLNQKLPHNLIGTGS